ncbi:MAG: flagellar hook-associated protein FlgK [Bryobacteraceae bacterium]
MSSLFGSLLNAGDAMRVYQRAMTVAENNITNASTPGYAKERLSFQAKSFSPENGLGGGVVAGNRESSRDPLLEQGVRRRNSAFSYSAQNQASLKPLEAILTVAKGAGIPDGMNQLFQSFSALSVSPNDPTLRQTVIDSAGRFASQINEAASQLTAAVSDNNQQASSAAANINRLVGQLASLNQSRRQTASETPDAGVDAQTNSVLEQLSGLADISVLNQPDGTVSVYLGGLTPLLVGESTYQITATTQSGQIQILDYQGKDITSNIHGGSMGGLLETGNSQIPSYLSDLNRLAASLADQVNSVLANGVDATGQAGAPLFTYNTASDAAATLAVTSLTPDQLAAAATDAPGGNGNALALADLGGTPQLDGMTFTAFYGNIGAKLGRDLSGATENTDTQQLLLDQARNVRQQASGVSIDEEAAHVMQLQRNYQAIGQLVSILNNLADTLMGMMQ